MLLELVIQTGCFSTCSLRHIVCNTPDEWHSTAPANAWKAAPLVLPTDIGRGACETSCAAQSAPCAAWVFGPRLLFSPSPICSVRSCSKANLHQLKLGPAAGPARLRRYRENHSLVAAMPLALAVAAAAAPTPLMSLFGCVTFTHVCICSASRQHRMHPAVLSMHD